VPLVNSYCFYGSNISTAYSFVFEGEILVAPYSATRKMDGDGNQDIIDNTFCAVWEGSATINNIDSVDGIRSEARLQTFSYMSKSFPGVSHMAMMNNDEVMLSVHQALSDLSGRSNLMKF